MKRIAAIADTGRQATRGATSSVIRSRKTAERTAASGVLAPAAKFAPLRFSEPLVAKPEKKPAAMLDSPWPMNS